MFPKPHSTKMSQCRKHTSVLPRANPSLGMGAGGALFKQEGLQVDRSVVKTGVSGKENQMDSKLKDMFTEKERNYKI